MGGTLTSKPLLPDTDATYDIGTSSKGYSTVYAKATSAQYADLAEIYETDSEYEVGTLSCIWWRRKEITTTDQAMGADTEGSRVSSVKIQHT